MRPVTRGEKPKDEEGNPVEFSEYGKARGELIRRMGQYCSYCEMKLDASLAVEHVQPKKPPGATKVDPGRALRWDNFLLACTNCNSTKSNQDVDLPAYLWPDQDNTFRALTYSEGGIVSPALEGALGEKATRTIKLMGLDKGPSNPDSMSDRRWLNRKTAWDLAQRSKANLECCDTPGMRDQIIISATGHGYWSIWMTVFSDDSDMKRRLIRAFPGTATDCFDPEEGYAPVPREVGQC